MIDKMQSNNSINSDYLLNIIKQSRNDLSNIQSNNQYLIEYKKGYLCALSMIEGIVAEMQTKTEQ